MTKLRTEAHEHRWLPTLTAAFTAVNGVISITTATMPAISWRHGWRTHVLTQVVPISVVRFCYALSLPLGIALLLVSVYLLRRRWRARHVALALLSLSCAVSLLKGLDFEGVALSALTAGVLYWGAEEFPVVQAPITLRSAVWRVPLIGAIGVAVVAFVDWMTSGRPTPDVILDQSSAAVRFRSTHAYFEDHTLRAFGHVVSFQWIPLGIHLVEIGTLLGIVYVLFKPLAAPKLWPSAAVRRQAVQIVQTYGQDTLSFFKLRQDKYYFFNEARTAFVGYRVEAGMMLLSGDPVGPPEEFGDLLLAVRRFARARGLRLGALGASEALVPIYEGLGLRTLYLGDEAVVETERFTLQGRAVRKVRQSVHRLQRAGYSAELCRLDEIAPATMDQIEQVIKVGRIGPRERGFAMGMDDIHGLLEQDTLFVLARDAQGTRARRHALRPHLRPRGDVTLADAPRPRHAQRADGVHGGRGDRAAARAGDRRDVVELRGADQVHA